MENASLSHTFKMTPNKKEPATGKPLSAHFKGPKDVQRDYTAQECRKVFLLLLRELALGNVSLTDECLSPFLEMWWLWDM